MIPGFINIGGPWKVLPPGVHIATMKEIETRFAMTNCRKHLFSGFEQAVISLTKSGCKNIYLDGSFITAKPIPEDYDVCWDGQGVDQSKLDPVFLDFSFMRRKRSGNIMVNFLITFSGRWNK